MKFKINREQLASAFLKRCDADAPKTLRALTDALIMDLSIPLDVLNKVDANNRNAFTNRVWVVKEQLLKDGLISQTRGKPLLIKLTPKGSQRSLNFANPKVEIIDINLNMLHRHIPKFYLEYLMKYAKEFRCWKVMDWDQKEGVLTLVYQNDLDVEYNKNVIKETLLKELI